MKTMYKCMIIAVIAVIFCPVSISRAEMRLLQLDTIECVPITDACDTPNLDICLNSTKGKIYFRMNWVRKYWTKEHYLPIPELAMSLHPIYLEISGKTYSRKVWKLYPSGLFEYLLSGTGGPRVTAVEYEEANDFPAGFPWGTIHIGAYVKESSKKITLLDWTGKWKGRCSFSQLMDWQKYSPSRKGCKKYGVNRVYTWEEMTDG